MLPIFLLNQQERDDLRALLPHINPTRHLFVCPMPIPNPTTLYTRAPAPLTLGRCPPEEAEGIATANLTPTADHS